MPSTPSRSGKSGGAATNSGATTTASTTRRESSRTSAILTAETSRPARATAATTTDITLPSVRRPSTRISTARPVQPRRDTFGGGDNNSNLTARGGTLSLSASQLRPAAREDDPDLLATSYNRPGYPRRHHPDMLLSAPISPRPPESLSVPRASGPLPPVEPANFAPQLNRLVKGMGDADAPLTAPAGGGSSSNNTSSNNNNTSGVAPVDPAAQLLAEAEGAFATFLQRLPGVWLSPAVRAATLQTVTEHTLPTLLTSAVLFDSYTELKSEISEDPDFRTPPPLPPWAAANNNNNINSNNNSNLTASPGSPDGRRREESLLSPEPSATPLVTDAAGGGGGAPTPAPPSPSLTGAQPPSQQQQQQQQQGYVNLCRLLLMSPVILRLAIGALQENKIKEIQEYERRENPQQPAPSRALIATQLLRPRVEKDVNFGVSLVQRAPRTMLQGSRLFLPQQQPPQPAPSLSLSQVHPGNSPGAVRNDLGSPLSPPLASGMLSPPAPPQPLPYSAATRLVDACSAVSFTVYPSIFLKYQYDMQRMDPARRARSQRRRHVQPFFEREFCAAFACGHASSALFCATLAPEFLVGLPSFLPNPQRAVTSGVRAALHRLYNVLTGEALRLGAHMHPCRHLLHAPSVDLALLYVRDNHCYFASTPGVEGRLFYLNSAAGPTRLAVELDEDFGGEMSSNTQGRLGSSMTSVNSMSLFSGTGAFDMPGVTHSVVVLPELHRRAREKAAAAAEGGGGSGAAENLTPTSPRSPEAGGGGGGGGGSGPESASNRFAMRGLSSNTVPAFRDFTAAAGGALPTGEAATATRFPHALVAGTAELWSVLPTALASDLLRTMLVLQQEAGAIVAAASGNGGTGRDGSPDPGGGSGGRDRRGSLAAQQAAATVAVHEYVAALTFFDDATRRRLIEFFEGRVAYYAELDERNAQTPQQRLEEGLRALAARRKRQQFISASSNGVSAGNSPLGSPAAGRSRRGSGASATASVGGNSGNNTNNNAADAPAAAAEEKAELQSLGDAMAAVLRAEAERAWEAQQRQPRSPRAARADEAELLFNRSFDARGASAARSSRSHLLPTAAGGGGGGGAGAGEDATLTLISDIMGDSMNEPSHSVASHMRSGRRGSAIRRSASPVDPELRAYPPAGEGPSGNTNHGSNHNTNNNNSTGANAGREHSGPPAFSVVVVLIPSRIVDTSRQQQQQ